MRASVYLHPSKLATVGRGHPWIFPKAIMKSKGVLTTGELVDVRGSEEELLGVGIYNEHSLYRVRVLARSSEVDANFTFESLLLQRLQQALSLRTALNLPNEKTNAYRLFNSEADGLSGLTIDRFNRFNVVSSSAYWVQAHKDLIIQCLQNVMPCDELIWVEQHKPLTQDGWKVQECIPSQLTTEVLEDGISFQINFNQTQKTGLFLDQRENHQRIAALAKGKRVLDLYSYTGGFALHAAKAGAAKVTAVDSSAAAIEQARQNAMSNGVDTIEFTEADARDFLKFAGDYDIVILDPPKLAPSQQHLGRAKNYYRFLHREVFKVMKPGALLMTCNCSSALTTSDFCSLVSSQAALEGKQARILGVFGPSSCHPTLSAFPEGQYLTAVLLAVY